MRMPPLAWSVELKDDELLILDETRLPDEEVYLHVRDYLEAARAITEMKTRALGQLLTILYTLLLTLRCNRGEKNEEVLKRLKKVAWTMENARPTFAFRELTLMVLRWAEEVHMKGERISPAVEERIVHFLERLKHLREKRVAYAASLIEDGSSLLTHCHVSGEMVLIGRVCREEGKKLRFYATETRPYFQGRLTSWELARDGFEVTLVPDNAVASLLAQGMCQLVMVGSDRVALNGDIVNKVGTFQLAVAAKTFHVPFYALVQEPYTTRTGEEIPIEERSEQELLCCRGRRIYPEGVKGYYPAFDITPASYITRLITFGGIIDPRELPRGWDNVREAMHG